MNVRKMYCLLQQNTEIGKKLASMASSPYYCKYIVCDFTESQGPFEQLMGFKRRLVYI